MISKEIRKKIKQIQLRTIRVLSGTLIGDYSSAKKGSGFEFDQIRAYEPGDDVRFIDWKSSAKSGKLLFKQYLEERNRNIIICLDVSSSSMFSSNENKKIDILNQVAAVLAIVSEFGKDRVSLVLFSDKIEQFVPPGVGSSHLQKLINTIFSFETKKNSKTDVNVALEHIFKMHFDNSIVFILSDFISENSFEKNLKIVGRNSDVIAIRCLDLIEKEFPNFGILNLVDLETGKELILKTSNKVKKLQHEFIDNQNRIFKKSRTDILDLDINLDFVPMIVKFFRKRLMY